MQGEGNEQGIVLYTVAKTGNGKCVQLTQNPRKIRYVVRLNRLNRLLITNKIDHWLFLLFSPAMEMWTASVLRVNAIEWEVWEKNAIRYPDNAPANKEYSERGTDREREKKRERERKKKRKRERELSYNID